MLHLTIRSTCSAIFLIVLLAKPSLAQTVTSVKFDGKHKIRHWILRNEIDLNKGTKFDPDKWELDRKRISSLGIFSAVKSDTTHDSCGVAISYDIREVWTIIPIFNIGGEIDNLDIDVGLMDKDFLGWYVEPGFVFSHFEDRTSFSTWLTMPRAIGRRVSIGIGFSKTHSLQSADRRRERYDFEYDARQIGGGGSVGYRFSERLSSSIGLQYRYQEYELEPAPIEPNNLEQHREQKRIWPSAAIAFGRIYYDDYFYEGIQSSIGGDLIGYDRDDYSLKYWIASLQTTAFLKLNSRFNIGSRLVVGRSQTDDILPAFATSGFSNIRGAEDRTRRGEHTFFINTEARMRLFQNGWLHTQTVAFVDVGNVWCEDPPLFDILKDSYLTYGIGARIGLVRFYNAIGRADVAVNTLNGEITVYVSAGQFF